MSLENIKDKIIAEAEQKAQDTLKKAKEEADQILRRGRKEAERIKKELISNAQTEALLRKNKIVSAASRQIRKAILEEKQNALGEAFHLAAKKVLNLPREEYQSFIENIILKAPIVSSNEVKIICNARDKGRITGEMLEGICSKLTAMNRKMTLTLSPETRDIRGGIIIRTGRIEINHSLEIVLRFLRDELEKDVYRSLLEDLGR